MQTQNLFGSSLARKQLAVALFFASLALASIASSRAGALPDLITFNFSSVESKVLPGGSTSPTACGGTIVAADQIGNFGLAAGDFNGQGCFSSQSFSNRNYPVDRGTVTPSSGGGSYPAYRVFPAQNPATNFLASQHIIFYRFPTVENYSVYSIISGTLAKVADIPVASIPNTTTFVQVAPTNPVSVDGFASSVIYVFAPSSTPLSSYTTLAPGVQGARVAATAFGDVLKYRYTVTGTPFDTPTGFTAGPADFGNIYSSPRNFFLVRNGSAIGVVWQDQVDLSLKLTWFGADRKSPTTVALANPAAQTLACATGDDTGNVYFFTVQPGDGAPNSTRNATLTKAGSTGATITTAAVNTAAGGLNMVQFFNGAALRYSGGKLGLLLGRIMTQSSDGLNHQGGIAVVFNATTLAVDHNWGQTSGHSWEQVLTTNSAGQFLGFDLGDNFPRGINLFKFDSASIRLRVINTFKTQHGTTPQNPAGQTFPVYFTSGGTTYYQWSNDNSTYTELGGLVQTPLGYTATFIGERSPGGLRIDNSRVGSALNDPRNIGLVAVRQDFENATGGGTVVSDDLVVSSGVAAETGQYYTFTGGLTQQRDAGMIWLTNYSTTAQNASRLKTVLRSDGNLMLIWETWTGTNYLATKGMTVSQTGTIVNAETDLSSNVRLGREDDPMVVSTSTYLASGNKTDKVVELLVIEPTTALVKLNIVKNGTNADISWLSTVGVTLQPQSIADLAPTGWANLGGQIAGDGTTKTVSVPLTTKEFFRLVIP